jgi:Ser/Thr protein kinase RdoA (MazF antagonist)
MSESTSPPLVAAEFIPRLSVVLGVAPTAVRFLQHSQNSVYEFTDARGMRRIARVTAGSHRSPAEIQSELDWISGLHRAGLEVCPPLADESGNLIRTLPDQQEDLHVVVFTRAAGQPLAPADLGPALYRRHGNLLGRLHTLARQCPPGMLAGRKRWDGERYFTTDIPAYLPETTQASVRARCVSLRDQLAALPAKPDDTGPGHLDACYSNLFRHGDGLELFDFDNCATAPFAADIAAALYGSIFHWLRRPAPGDRSAFEHPGSSQNLAQVWAPFREGYLAASPWPDAWNEAMPLWFQVMYLRLVVHTWRVLHPVTNPKTRAALETDIENLRRGDLPLRFDFQRGRAIA